MILTSTGDRNIPRVIALVAMGPSHTDYTADCIAGSGRKTVADETWAINAMGGVIEHDRAFVMDDLRYFAQEARQNLHLQGYKDWLHICKSPIYTSAVYPEFPASVQYPLQDVLNSVKFPYFNGTCAYALAYAIHLGVRHIKLYGMDYTQKANKGFAEAGRACVEYWIAVASWKGIKVSLSSNTTLCDHDQGRPLYGYSVAPKIDFVDGNYRVEYPTP